VDFRGKVAQPVTNPSTYDEGTPDYSPDGKKIVFASSRSGTMEIFVANADGSNATQLTTMAASTTGYPRWSPDGGKIVFNSRIEGQSAIYLLELTEGTVRRLTPAGLRGRWPSWSRDGRSIYYSSDSTGRYELWKMGADGSGPVQITRDGGLAGQESVDRRWVFYTKGGGTTPSLWKTPVRGGRHTQVIGGLSFAYHFVVSAKAIFLTTGPTLQECVLELYDPVTGTRRILHKPDRNCGIGITVSPDERQVLYALVDDERSDLMVADFR
jgi:Tol biopolymer transport system component